ncbi:oncoprotein-induced transcript 3 protein-like [Mytilus galloprovincialis]|uniref:oncoprotein-induced transcript 3 protein-like n=1 Tax=Mytilus galloprovincialis TaxID=29158 RepID=UPI003F7BF41B
MKNQERNRNREDTGEERHDMTDKLRRLSRESRNHARHDRFIPFIIHYHQSSTNNQIYFQVVLIYKGSFTIYLTMISEPTTDSVRWNLTSAAERHDVSCLSDSISVFIPSDLLSHYQTTWRDPHCQVQDNGTHYVSTISHTSCGTTVIFTKDEVIFENELILHKSGSPSNQTSNDSIDFGSSDSEVIPVQCIYPRRQNISTLYRPAQSTVRFYEKRYGHMDVQLEQYKSGMFVTPLPVRSFPNEVEINKDMYFILHAMHVNSTDVAVKVDSCVATPSNIPADGRIYQLLDQGCPASPAVKVYPSAFDEVRFSVRAFEFRTSPGGIVYIHCQVSVCSPTSPQCRVGCAHRHRREVSTEDGGSHLVSGGPYLLVADKGGLQVSTVVAGVCASVAVVATVIAIIGWRRKSSASTSSSKL